MQTGDSHLADDLRPFLNRTRPPAVREHAQARPSSRLSGGCGGWGGGGIEVAGLMKSRATAGIGSGRLLVSITFTGESAHSGTFHHSGKSASAHPPFGGGGVLILEM